MMGKEGLFAPALWFLLGTAAAIGAFVSFSEANSVRPYYASQGIGCSILAAALWLGAAHLHARRAGP
jgi:hypothetical protein